MASLISPLLTCVALRPKTCWKHWATRDILSPKRCSLTLLIELRARHSSLANNVVELAASQIRAVRVGQLDLLAIVDPVIGVIAVVILYTCQVTSDEVIIDLRYRHNMRH